MPRVEFHFDFGSPHSYLAHQVVPGIEQRTGARFEYVPVLLGGIFKATNNKPPMESLAGIRNKPEFAKLQTKRFVHKHGIRDFVMNPFFPVNTLAIMRGAVAAKRLNVLMPYVNAVFDHMWAEQKNMADPQVIRAALLQSGLDADRLIELSGDPEVKAELIANTNSSVERGTFGAPTFFVDNEIYFGKDQLRDVEDAIRGV